LEKKIQWTSIFIQEGYCKAHFKIYGCRQIGIKDWNWNLKLDPKNSPRLVQRGSLLHFTGSTVSYGSNQKNLKVLSIDIKHVFYFFNPLNIFLKEN
jgi:hypothetical protein